MKITEVIDIATAYPIEEYRFDSEGTLWIAYAHDSEDREIKILLNPLGINDDHLYIQFSRDEQHGVTGWGDAGRVFATVLKAIKIYMREHRKPRVIIFLAEEPKRQSLYRRMINKFGKQFGYELDSAIQDHFRLIRRKKTDK